VGNPNTGFPVSSLGLASTVQSRLVVPYTVGGPMLKFNVCPGDRFTIQNVQIADNNPAGANLTYDADQMLPYMVYQPYFLRNADYGRGSSEQNSALYGNDTTPPKFRMSLCTTFWAPWIGDIYILGGAAVVSVPATPAMILQITIGWSRNCRAEQANKSTLALYNAQTFDIAGNPIRIQRPDFAKNIWTPNNNTVTLDFGPGTPQAVQPVNFALPVDFGPYPFFFFQALTPPPIIMMGTEW
jgi:hypothetical protein